MRGKEKIEINDMIVSKKANEIAEQDDWFKSILSRHPNILIKIDAVDFKDQAYILAGPFAKRFAYVEISHSTEDLQTPEEQSSSIRKHTIESVIFWPYALREKIFKAFGQSCQFWFNKDLKTSISDLDISEGASTDGFVYCSECSLFATTEKGIKKLFSPLSEYEYEKGLKELEPKILQYIEEAEKTIPTTKKPYRVYVCGNDDASWSKTFSTIEECKLLLEDLHNYGADAMLEQMVFTN
jgi:hypothetical protein